MIRPKLFLICCCVAAFGLTMFNAGAAQAETGARWLELNSSGWTVFLEAEVGLQGDSLTRVLHSEILKIKVLFSCTWIEAINVRLKANGSVGGFVFGSQIKFFNCATLLNGAVFPECEPKDVVHGWGSIVTKPIHGLLQLNGFGEIVKLLPVEGETLAVVEMSAACPIGTKVPVIGKLTLKDCENLALTHLVKHLVEQGPGTELWTISKTAEHAATLLGSAWAYLVGEHTGLKFSGDPA